MERFNAIQEIGKRMGHRKFDQLMGGSMNPRGTASIEEALSLVYGGTEESVRQELDRICRQVFEELRRRPGLGARS